VRIVYGHIRKLSITNEGRTVRLTEYRNQIKFYSPV
jgi:hypothetical protein